MKKLLKKSKSKSGETFVELIIAVLIVAFGCLILATAYSASLDVNIGAAEADEEYYSQMDLIEKGENKKDGDYHIKIKVDGETDIDVAVDVYGNDSLSTYKLNITKDESKKEGG